MFEEPGGSHSIEIYQNSKVGQDMQEIRWLLNI